MGITFVRFIVMFFALSWIMAVKSMAQSLPGAPYLSDQYILDQWGTDDGLPVNSIHDIIQSRDGYLWLATNDGLVRFDGIDFKVYTSSEYKELKSNRIHFLEEAADGSILIKTEGVHISRLKDGIITHLLSLDISISGNGSNSQFYKDDHGQVWVGGDDGLYVYRDGSFQRMFTELIDFQVFNIEYISDSEIWFTSHREAGLFRIKDNTLEKIFSRNSKGWELDFYAFKNEIWISSSHGLFRFSDERLDTMYAEYNLELAGVRVYSESEIYLADSNKGYIKIKDGEIVPLPYSYGSLIRFNASKIINGSVWDMTTKGVYREDEPIFEGSNLHLINFKKDKEGNIWVGTINDGLFRLRPKLFKTYSEQQGLPKKSVYSIFQSRDSTIWVGTFGGGIAKITDGNVEAGFGIKVKDDISNAISYETNKGFMQSFAETEDGTLLLSSLESGLQYLDRATKTTNDFKEKIEWTSYACYSLFYDSNGYLWAGFDPYTSKGLARFKNGEWEQISGKENVPLTTVRNILETPTGELWFATLGHGLIRFDGTQYYNYDVTHGLSSDLVRGLHITEEDDGTVLWVGFEDMGLDRISLTDGAPNFDSITNYQTTDGFFDNSVHTVLEDQNQRFWINSNRGIFRVDRRELNAFHRGDIENLSSHGYTEQDGLLSREGNGGVYPSGIIDFNGRIWFPSQDGVVSFHPESIINNNFIPPVKIQEVRSSDTKTILSDNKIILDPEERDIEISYVSLSFTDPEKNQYRYILEGYDLEWRNVGTRRTAYYTNLPKGNYTFRVQGSNNEGIWNTEGASLVITVSPYFHETAVFYFLMLMVATSLVFVFLRLRNQYFKKREQVLKKQVAHRTKELEEEKEKTEQQAQQLLEMDEVKSRFFTDITHELRTPLTLIMGPLEQLVDEDLDLNTENGKKQKEMMLRNSKRLLKLVDQLLDISRLEVGNVLIKPKPVKIIPFLRKCISLFSEAFDNKHIEFSITSSVLTNTVCIDPEKIEKVLGNIIINAIKFTPPGGQITITLDETDSEFIIKIADTGIGITEEETERVFDRFYRSENAGVGGFGIGLSIAKEMINLHHGEIRLKSRLGFGTTFFITLLKGNEHFIKEGKGELCSKKIVEGTEPSDLLIEDILTEEEELSLPVNFSQDKTTILIVDDNADMRFYISSVLGNEYQMIEAKDGSEAYEKITHLLPDLIVADIMMPGMDGMELNKKLKGNPVTAGIPFIFLTAKTDKHTRISGIEDGADFFLTKPFDKKELIAIVNNLLHTRQSLREKISKNLSPETSFISSDQINKDPFVQKLYEVLEEEYSNQNLSVSMIEEKMYMSRSAFYRKINEKTGINTQQFVNRFRLEKASQLLLNEEGNVSEIACACGFKSLSYFSKAFKDHFGESPTEFLKSHSLKS